MNGGKSIPVIGKTEIMAQKIPYNPEVLKWARQTAGMQLHEVAHRMGKDAGTISLWETGESSPTYIQLEKLAYKIYKRPLALFFFPEPPEEESLEQAFRTLPESEIQVMSRHMHLLIREAQTMQINVSELNDYKNPAKRNLLKDLQFTPQTPLSKMVSQVRDYLDIDLTAQFSWKNTGQALKTWRNTLEDHGIYIFKDAFKDDAYSAFCLHNEEFPIIYINNSTPKTRQIFSIFHELAHLLMGTGGVDARNTDYIKTLRGNNKKIEVLCNRFAGAFLVPDAHFSKQIKEMEITPPAIESLALKYKVSREVIMRKLLDKKLVSQQDYDQNTEKWRTETKPASPGGNFYLKSSKSLN